MKKLLILLFISHGFAFGQMLEYKDAVIELDLGIPNFKPITTDPSGFDHSIFNFGESEVKAYGQFILKGEYFISDEIGFAAAFNYGYWYMYDEAVIDTYDGVTGQWTQSNYFYETKVHKIRFTVGVNFHMLRTERVDTYFGFQGGGKNAFGSYRTDDPNAQGNVQAYVFPVAARVHFGTRFFFNEFLAANLEFGLGGPLLSFGATYKF